MQTLPEEKQTPYTTVTVLEGMDSLKLHMKVQYVIEGHLFSGVIVGKQSFHSSMNLFGCNCFLFSHFVGKSLVVAYGKPLFATVGGVVFEDSVQCLDMRLGDLIRRVVNDIIDTAEVVHRLHDIIDGGVLCRDAKCIGLEDIARLFFGQFAAFDMVGVVGQINLRTMVDTALQFGFFLFAKTGKERRESFLSFLGKVCISRDVPCFSCQKGTINLSRRTIITCGTFANAVFLGKLYNGYIFHNRQV